MGKKGTSTAKKVIGTAVKKKESVDVPVGFDYMTEDVLRTVAAEDMKKMKDGEEVDCQDVTINNPTFIRELGGKVLEGETHPLPVSVVAYYMRTRPGIFGDQIQTNQGDDTSKPEEEKLEEGDVTNTQHNAEGEITN